MLLQGLFIPVTCPFNREGMSYLRKLEYNVQRYSLGPVAGLVALSPGTEAAALTDPESKEVLCAIAAAAAKEKVLVAGVEQASVYAALERAAWAEEAGYDVILLAPPTDWPRLLRENDARELLLFYQCVADASPLPIVLWSSAEAPALQLPVSAIAELALHPNIMGLVDSDLTMERLQLILNATKDARREAVVTTIFEAVTRRMLQAVVETPNVPQGLISIGGSAEVDPFRSKPATLKTRSRTVGFQVLSAGHAHSMLPLLEAGVAGVMPTLAACAPQGCFEAYAAWKDGNPALAVERGGRLQAAEALLSELGPAGVKYACDWNGYFGGPPRLPRVSLTAEQGLRVERALGEVRN